MIDRSLACVCLAGALAASACSGSSGSSDVSDGSLVGSVVPGSVAAGSVASTVATSTPEPPVPGPVAPVAPVVTVLGPEQVVFDWSQDRCADDMRPDLPVRFFRVADGTLRATMSDPVNHLLVGDSFESMAPTCPPVLTSAFDPDPSAFHHFEWFGATYTEDGQTIHAVVHNEFHGDEASLADWNRDFSPGRAGHGWSALGRSSAGEFELQAVGTESRADDSLCLIGFWGMHPDSGCVPIHRWTATTSGTLVVSVQVSDADSGGGDGVDFVVEQNGVALWSVGIDNGDETPHSIDLEVAMAAGDRLDFSVSSRSDPSYDATNVAVQITDGARACTSADRSDCQQVSLTAAVSHDGGQTWSSPATPNHLIASVPERYVPDAGFVAIWQPSNIVRNPSDGYFYMLVQSDYHRNGIDAQGTCVLRTATLDDPSSWRAWDGTSFSMTLPDPYTTPDIAAAGHTCPSVVAAPVGGLTFNTSLEQFVAVVAGRYSGIVGNFLRTSRDLITWSEPVLVNEAEFSWTGDGRPPYEAYATLVDPASDSLSFDTSGATPYLYFSRFNSLDPRDYDLVRIPIQLQPG